MSTSSTSRSSRRDLTTGDITTHLIRLTLPMIVGVLSLKLYNVVDTYFVSKLGTRELAAISFTFPVVLVFGNLTIGLAIGTSSLVARTVGKGSPQEVARLVTDSLFLACLIVGIATVAGLLTIDPLFRLLGATEETLPLISDYMTTWYFGIVFLVIPMIGNSALRATGDALFPAIQMVIASALNCLLDPLLIFGAGPIPALGIKGAALATVISRACILVASLGVLGYRDKLLSMKDFCIKRACSSWSRVIRIGGPAACTNMIVPVSSMIITALLAGYGAQVVAGFGVASRIEGFALTCFLALSSTIGPVVGQNWGAEHYERVQSAIQTALRFCFLGGGVVTVFLLVCGPFIISFFSTEPPVADTAYHYLLLVSLSYGAQGAIYSINATFNALGYALRSTVVSFIRMFLLTVPCALIAEQLVGLSGILGAAAIGNIGAVLCGYLWLKKTTKRQAI